jgi:signal transduction histidine kinase
MTHERREPGIGIRDSGFGKIALESRFPNPDYGEAIIGGIAVQHTPKGGAVSVDVSPNGSRVHVRVIDAGGGIPEADRDRIFDRFVQLDPLRRADGTGLGRTIAKWIAEAHEESLSLEASSPAGSTFCVVLPVSH